MAVQVEKFIKGENYRILVLGDKVIAAVHRKPPYVTGDGKSTIKQLIEARNIERINSGMMEIPIDEITETRLSFDDLTLDSVLENGKSVSVRLNANMSTGGISRECLNELHPYYQELAVKATQALGMKFSGVDLICEDITNPQAGHAINEVNFHPGLRLHYKVDEGEIIPVAREIMKEM
jgi:cyanophycin synthetase